MVAVRLSQQEQPHHCHGTSKFDDGRYTCGLFVHAWYQAGLVRIIKRKLKKIQRRPTCRWLPGRRRPENRALVITCTTRSIW